MTTVTVINIEGQVQWEIGRDGRSGDIVAVCKPLGMVMHGKDVLDLQTGINDSLNLLFRNLLRSGELEAFLRAHGWKAGQLPIAHSPEWEDANFNVPIELIAAKGRDGQARTAH